MMFCSVHLGSVSSKTLLNSGSSRSHAIYQLTLNGQVFMIIDLAGAERK